jgi:predicted PurR-regulated permease PerM
LNPFWVFVSILTGVRVGGLLGVVVAVPMAVVIKEALVAVRSVRKPDDLMQNPSASDTSATIHLSEDTEHPQKSGVRSCSEV